MLSMRALGLVPLSFAADRWPLPPGPSPIARTLDDPHVLAYALNSSGRALSDVGEAGGDALIEESLRISLAHDLTDDAARAYNNLIYVLTMKWQFDEALAPTDDGLAYTTDHDLNGSYLCLLAGRVSLLFNRADWAAAETRCPPSFCTCETPAGRAGWSRSARWG